MALMSFHQASVRKTEAPRSVVEPTSELPIVWRISPRMLLPLLSATDPLMAGWPGVRLRLRVQMSSATEEVPDPAVC